MLVKDFIHIDAPFSELLSRSGLDHVQAVLHCPGDQLAAWSRSTDTISLKLPDSTCSIYIKRYHYPRWRQRLRGMLRGTLFRASRALSEFRALVAMRRLGIHAVRPIAYGERRICGFVRSCFLITEAVPDAMSLVTFIKTFANPVATKLARRNKIEILTSLARQVRHMHEQGFVHRDLFWRNVLIRPLPDERFEFYFLDASVGRRIRFAPRRQDSIVHDIAAMGVLAPEFCSTTDQMRFLLEYLNTERLTPDDRAWLRRVQARQDRFRDAELIRLERGSVFDQPLQEIAVAP